LRLPHFALFFSAPKLVRQLHKGFHMLTKINHIGVAVNSIESALPYYRDALGMALSGIEEVPSQQVKVAFLSVGESKIELLEPTSPESPVAKFLEKNGPGTHHVAYGVADIEAAIAKLVADGVRMIDSVPRQGAHGAKIAFIHPKSSGGVLTELCQSEH
jgi:methylmalonyl-CoA/ethylmalonyl-CoA epimerase